LSAISQLHRRGQLSPGDISVDFYGGSNELIIKLSEVPAYAPFVGLMGHVTHDEAVKAQRGADLLLLLESNQLEAKGVLTGKVFEYISSGVPILSLGSGEDSEIYELLKQTSTGVCVGNSIEKVIEIIVEMLNGELDRWFSPNIEKIIKYSRQSQAELMYSKLISNASE
jgi:glycosyltransferase involved in cell wall biosynthesis